MADLDDFFAKKDRKKSKSVKKFATTDEVAKKLDEPKKPETKPKKDRQAQEGDEANRGAEDEEWKEFEEPVKDYTGLKIQVLQGGNGQPEQGREHQSEDSTPDSSKTKGPWNKPQVEQVHQEPPVHVPVEEKKEQPPRLEKYVPPSARNAAPAAAPLRRTQTKNAPDISNDDYFPMLGAAVGGGGRGGTRGGGWSTAAAAGRAPAPASSARQPLALGNRFTSLPHDS